MGTYRFVKTDPAEDLYRWYTITWGPTLWGTWALVRAWGRLDSEWAQEQVQEFARREDAAAAAQAEAERRRQRGYTETPL